MIEKEYYLGLDCGTSSVGWAVTDSEYHLLRTKGKDLWGVRLFDEAETAAGRRSKRISRRRTRRAKLRNSYLKSVFEKEINKVDPGFLQRLDESKYWEEDKTQKTKFALFNDGNFTDKEYYQKYPTVFHLIKELIENPEQHDVRLVYLACLNIYKHRGHFLNTGISGTKLNDVNDLLNELDSYIEKEKFTNLSQKKKTEFQNILSSSRYSRKEKTETLTELLEISKKEDAELFEMVKSMCGMKITLAKIFTNQDFDEENEKYSISFYDGNLEENLPKIEEMLNEENYEVFLLLKDIYEWGVLSNLMKDNDGNTCQYLSYARVASYEKHQKDLRILKRVYKRYNHLIGDSKKTIYSEMFRVMGKNNYSSYVGSVNSGREKERRGGSFDKETFMKSIKSNIELHKELDPDVQYILEEIDKDTFLPKQMTGGNGVIPYQLHLAELTAILDNAEKYLDFLKETDESGLSSKERIIQMFRFTVPYYIGPVFKGDNSNAWVVRKEAGRVYPWNFDEKIDAKETAQKFIERMVRKCTYINDETCLPKNSLMYQKFMVLNELNNLKIDGNDIPVQLKQNIYKDLFTKGKKVTSKSLVEYLKRNGIVAKDSNPVITGIDGDFINTLSSYAKFK